MVRASVIVLIIYGKALGVFVYLLALAGINRLAGVSAA
jgi:hypothetical protein